MNVKNIVTGFFGTVSLASIYLASGISEVPNWWELAKPFFVIGFISLVVALVIYNINHIRRVTYPALVCLSSWAYKNKIVKTKFTKNTYRLYKWKGRSCRNLFGYVQQLFDVMYF